MDSYFSAIGAQDEESDALIDNLEDGANSEFIDLVYEKLSEQIDSIDFGGGVKGITCRSLLEFVDNADDLRKKLGMKRTNHNNQKCSAFIAQCRDEVKKEAYLH